MAISYSLELATPSSAAQVADALREVGLSTGLFAASVGGESLLGDGAETRHGMWTRVTEVRPRPWNPVTADLGFTPTVSIAFRLDKQGEIADQQDDMVRLVSGLLAGVTGDAVLHSGFEDIWLLRHRSEVSVSEQDDLWPPRRLALLSQRYRRATHTFSEE